MGGPLFCEGPETLGISWDKVLTNVTHPQMCNLSFQISGMILLIPLAQRTYAREDTTFAWAIIWGGITATLEMIFDGQESTLG